MAIDKASEFSLAVLIIAPIGRDAELLTNALAQAGIQSRVFRERDANEAFAGSGALVLEEEALNSDSAAFIVEALGKQPVWSDIPVIVLAGLRGFSARSRKLAEDMFAANNVTILQRPTPMMTLISAVRAALRARTRQFEVKELLENRERQVNDRDAFLAMLGHELRNPLAPVRNAIQILKMENASAGQRSKARELMERQVGHLSRLVDDLLDMARISSGKISLRMEECNLVELLRACVDDNRPNIDPEIGMELRLPEGAVWVRGDRTRLSQIFGNLV